MIETVRNNFENFTKEENEMVKLSRETQAINRHPPDSVFKQIVSEKNLKNYPVEVDDVSNANSIFGYNRDRLEGMNTRQKLKRTKVNL